MRYKKIIDMEQYNRHCEIHEKLTSKDYDSNRDELELIEIMIDEYESREIEYQKRMNPVELLEHILEEDGTSKAQLAWELKVSRQLITDIMMYRRNIGKTMVQKLSKRFKMQSIAFSREYKLKRTKKAKQLTTA